MSRTRVAAVVAVAIAAAGLAGCGAGAERVPAADTEADTQVVSRLGLAEIRFGDTRAALEREHGLVQGPGDCAPRLPAHPTASPVFDGDRLVLLWAGPPLQTAAGLAVGSPVAQVRQAHPGAEELRAPPGSHRFDGLLATVDGRAYLFLHDQQLVQKLIIGYEKHARLVFQESFGTC